MIYMIFMIDMMVPGLRSQVNLSELWFIWFSW